MVVSDSTALTNETIRLYCVVPSTKYKDKLLLLAFAMRRFSLIPLLVAGASRRVSVPEPYRSRTGGGAVPESTVRRTHMTRATYGRMRTRSAEDWTRGVSMR